MDDFWSINLLYDIIDFSLPGEENEFAEDPVDSIEATVQVTTFYYEGDE
ncbi:hypothetical protein [Ureibacillus sp. FSL K6-0786]